MPEQTADFDTAQYAGRTLAYIRTILGEPPKYARAIDAANAAAPLNSGMPKIGAPAYYRTANQNGNIALYVGDGLVLCLDSVRGVGLWGYADEHLGEYLGWAPRFGSGHDE